MSPQVKPGDEDIHTANERRLGAYILLHLCWSGAHATVPVGA